MAGRVFYPSLDVVGCLDHRKLATEVAARSLTLVRDRADLLPLRVGPDQRILVVMTKPENLTPADTSAEVEPVLVSSIRHRHLATTELVVSHHPTPTEIADAIAAAPITMSWWWGPSMPRPASRSR